MIVANRPKALALKLCLIFHVSQRSFAFFCLLSKIQNIITVMDFLKLQRDEREWREASLREEFSELVNEKLKGSTTWKH